MPISKSTSIIPDPSSNGHGHGPNGKLGYAPPPIPSGENSNGQAVARLLDGQAGRVGQDGRDFQGAHPTPEVGVGPVAAVEEYFTAYMVLPDRSALVIALWTAAAWLQNQWDRFP